MIVKGKRSKTDSRKAAGDFRQNKILYPRETLAKDDCRNAMIRRSLHGKDKCSGESETGGKGGEVPELRWEEGKPFSSSTKYVKPCSNQKRIL
ncbi:MAG: hypothetical protein NTV25_03195 [Methanothrix sp.]|nr:hypothetical protein [Methanothrix sp.]